MHRVPIASSVIRSVGYDPKTFTLEVEFLETGVYCYYDVPPIVFKRLLASSSKGHYFDYSIRDLFRYAKAA